MFHGCVFTNILCRYWPMRKEVGWKWCRFKQLTLKFSKKSVQTPSCKRTKTTQWRLFLLFEINNCFQITAYCRRCIGEKSGNLQATCSIQKTLFILCRQSKYRWGLLRFFGLSQDGPWTNFDKKNLGVNRIKRVLSIDITFNPHLFSLVNTSRV